MINSGYDFSGSKIKSECCLNRGIDVRIQSVKSWGMNLDLMALEMSGLWFHLIQLKIIFSLGITSGQREAFGVLTSQVQF